MNILIISHYFPPLNVVASYRIRAFARDFALAGCKVYVLTTKKKVQDGVLDLDGFSHPNLTVHEIDYPKLFFWKKDDAPNSTNTESGRIVAKNASAGRQFLRSLINSLGFLLDHQYFWSKRAVKTGTEIIAAHSIDVILSSFSPMSSHVIAGKLKKNNPKIKWVADYRDLWTRNPAIPSKGFWNVIEGIVERRVIRKGDLLSTVSEPLKEELEVFFGQRKNVKVIYNGFEETLLDPVALNRNALRLITTPIVISYTGTIYAGRSNPYSLFMALHQLEKKGVIKKGDIVVNFYGSMIGNLADVVELADASDWVNIKGHLSHLEIRQVQQNSDLLLFLESGDSNAKGVLTGKLFEYMISGTPILAIGISKEGSAAAFIEESSTGVVLKDNVEEIVTFLSTLLEEKCIRYFKPNVHFITQFSREKQSLKLLEEMKKMLHNG